MSGRFTHHSEPGPLDRIELGDVVTLPDGRSLTVRARVPLAVSVGTMAGFVICGDMAALLSTPALTEAPVVLYQPVNTFPERARSGRSVCEGAAAYWAPHLPAVGGAMGEILWRVVEVRGSVDPIVIVYRGNEITVFVRAGEIPPGGLDVLYMRRDVDNDIAVERHSAVVLPAQIPVPDYVPEQVPDKVAAPAPSRRARR